MSTTTAGNLINRGRKQSCSMNKISKEQSTVKKLASSSASNRRLSFTSTMLTGRVGSLARRSILISSEGKSFDRYSIASGRPPVQVYDDLGKDVTPRPLYQPEPSAAGPTSGPMHRQSKILSTQDFAGAVPTEFLSSLSLQQASGTSISLAGPFSRTYGSSSITKSTTSTESMAEEIIEPGSRLDVLAGFIDVQVRREEVPEPLTKGDLEKRVDIFLTETETIWLFDMPTVMLSTEAEEADSVRKKNVAYMELCKNRAGNDRYVNRMMQTIGGEPKTKEMQCDKIIMEDKEIMATTWDLYDSFNALETAIAEKSTRPISVTSSKSTLYRGRDRAMSVASVGRESTTSSIIDLESIILSRIHEEIEDRSEAILKSEKFNQDLFYMERVLMENIFQPKLAAYRQLPVLIEPTVKSEHSLSEFEEESIDEEEEEEEEALSVRSSLLLEFSSGREEILPPYIEGLWTYACDLMRGNNVSCLAWNKLNPWPERVYQSPHGVTALDFSLANPNLLAVGLYNGTIAVYNVQTHYPTSVLDTSESYDKHLGPVWQLRWVEQDRGITGEDKGEILVSISADGRVTKWFVRKGLSCNDLMKLKRTASDKKKGGAEKKSEALISRQAPGLSFDFHPKDTNIYLAGTEEGFIHKCSCSYNEQYLETYRGHKGPVYKIAWNPFSTEVFLSCSADWSIILWREDSVRPVLTFSSTANVIYDIAWSPTSAYVFAAANETRVEIWDLSVSTLDPLIVHPATGTVKFTAVLFAKNADCLLIGDSEGSVTVYALRNMIPPDSKKVRSATLKAEVAYPNRGPF
ncbi:dynein axonemal intermediate chain 4 isoform X3 [Zootoca vivipara]|uniref:dynein axonemal intermediate chain 4 isoform X3 n=1 Tax=Zootoca vivipara TaxID=8524 RepID=UPI00293B8AF4|nr:dynein axonemal intermediate chain 4 isoform X3 [Zootoca vivipara]